MNAQLVLENVGMRLPNRVLFEGINWTLYEGMRVALAGRNGSGKSTLLRIMAGRLESTEGRCTVVGGRKLRIGYLDQTLLDRAVVETLGLKDKSLSPVRFIQDRLSSEHPETEEAELEWETRKILGGLGFSKDWMNQPMNRLSGGWLLRMFIAAALLDKPEVLLLDEPTNHLDISSIQWLEEFLQKEYEGSLVLVTHDVALQKRTTDSIAIVHGGKFYFRTHQQDYLTFRDSLADEKRHLESHIASVQRKIDESMEFFYKFRAKAQTAARAQSKLKAAEELTEELNQLKDRLARIEGFAYNLKFRFRLSGPGGKFPLSTKKLSFRYAESSPWILKDINMDVSRGQRIAIIGDNGAGKTTLLNVLAGRLKPTEGEVTNGHAVELGYFGQHQLDELSLEDTVLDNLRTRAHGVSLEEVRGWLGAFGFAGNDECQKKAKVLSGGEKARLSLLRILPYPHQPVFSRRAHEPSRHRDQGPSEGSHPLLRGNRHHSTFPTTGNSSETSPSALCTLSHDHQLTDHLGNLARVFEKYPHLVRHLEGRAKPSDHGGSDRGGSEAKPQPEGKVLSYEERKKIKNQIRSLEKKKTAAAEQEIDQLGGEKVKAQSLMDSAKTPDEQNTAYQRLSAIESTLHARMVEWEKWCSELEELRKQAPGVT